MAKFDSNRRFQKKYADEVFALWQDHLRSGMLPTSARFLFYELVAQGTIDKHAEGNPSKDVAKALLWLRTHDADGCKVPLSDDGVVPWGHIADETRTLRIYSGYDSFETAVRSTLNNINILDVWRGKCPLLLTESRSLAGVINHLASQYRCMITSSNGQVGGFLRTGVVPAMRDETLVLYLGDYDRQGEDIEGNSRRVIEARLGCEANWERLLLTEAQVKKWKLPTIFKLDKRDGKSDLAVEAEALNQSIIVDLVESRLKQLLPESLESVRRREGKMLDALFKKLR
jgi:hypothetical protein